MPNQITDWREYLVTTLAAAFPLAEVESGRRQGVSRDKDRIAVFFAGYEVDPARVVVAKPLMIVRFWKQRSRQPASDTPPDPGELEQATVDLLDALRPIQGLTGIAGRRPWFFVIRSVLPDYDPEEWGVEARLEGFTANEGTIA